MQGAHASYDLTLICGRRPELLQQTLASFAPKVFAHFPFANVIANIDPFCGTDEDGAACAALIRSHFPQAQIFMPDHPGFGAAVMRIWQASHSDIILHLEDDWLALEPIMPDRVERDMTGDVMGLTLMCATKNTRNQQYQTARRRIRRADGTEEDQFVNAFSTSPGFFAGPFVRHAATLMRPEFDPEKQFSRSLNPDLEAYAMQYRCKFLFGSTSPFIVEDIGRPWQREKGIVKSYERRTGRSTWSNLG